MRAFKSTLDEMEERRSIHSLHSLRTSRSHPGPRPLYDISYIDEEAGGGFGGKLTPARESPPPPNRQSNSQSSASSEKDQLLVKETNSGQMERSRSAPFNNLSQGENGGIILDCVITNLLVLTKLTKYIIIIRPPSSTRTRNTTDAQYV